MPLYLQPPLNFFEGDLGEWDSAALFAWGSDKYIYLKESRISSNDGERIDAYVLDQYGEILNYYEGVAEGLPGTSVKYIQIGGVENENLYFSYQTNVWTGSSSPSVKVSSLNLTNFSPQLIFEHGIQNYSGSIFDIRDHEFKILNDGSAYLAAFFNDANVDNVIRIQLHDGQYENVVDIDTQIERLVVTSSGFAVVGIGHESYWGSGDNLHFQLYNSDGTPLSDELYFDSQAHQQFSLVELKNDNIVFAYSDVWGKFVAINIYTQDGSTLLKEIEITGYVAKYPRLLATSDGGFLLSFLYSDNKFDPDYHRDQVIVRFDSLGNQVSESFRKVTDEYSEISSLAIDQDGGVIGVSGDELGLKSAVFLAQLFGTPGDDNLSGTDDVNTIFTFSGDDVIHSLGGNDYIDAGDGNNSIYAGYGSDLIWLDAGVNFVDGGEGADWILFDDEQSVVLDLSIETTQDFGSFSAQLTNVENIDAGIFDDILFGSALENRILGRAGNDTILGQAGDDELLGGTGNDVIDGGEGDDKIEGDDGDDVIDGGAGNDYLFGGDGDDLLNGGEGDDLMDGGEDYDVARFEYMSDVYNLEWDESLDLYLVNSTIEGTDTLIDIEKVEFPDGYMLLSEDGSISDFVKFESKATFTAFKNHVLSIFDQQDSLSLLSTQLASTNHLTEI